MSLTFSARFAPLVALISCLVACGGKEEESTVETGTGARTGLPDQPNLNLGGSTSPTGNGDPNGGTGTSGDGCGVNLVGRVRDFKAAEEPGGHPDFETFAGNGASVGIVQDLLVDSKPVYKPTGAMVSMYGQQTTDKAHFDQWYRDTEGVNMPVEFTVPLTTGADGVASYNNDAFFPVDKQAFGNYQKMDNGQLRDTGHNFGFTFELHTEFTYQGGETFRFKGDDDLWVFVNGHLGLDLGGLHPEVTDKIVLDDVAQAFGLEVGKSYPLDLFHAERHTEASHFRVETSIKFTNCRPIIIPK